MNTEPKYIALLVSKREGEHPTYYLVKAYGSLGVTCDFKRDADRAEALHLSKAEAERQVWLHNAFCSDSPLCGVIELA